MRRLPVLYVASAIAGCGSVPPAAPVTSQPPVVALPSEEPAPRQDAEDRDARLRRKSRAAVATRPALQRLPWLERHLAVDLHGVTSDGRVALIVRSDLGRDAARLAYRRFLRRSGDDGRAYLPTFRPAG